MRKYFDKLQTLMFQQNWSLELTDPITVDERDALTHVDGLTAEVEGIGKQRSNGTSWVTVETNGGKGKVLQVVRASTSTEVSVATTTWTDTGLSATITPKSATSEIHVFINQSVRAQRNSVGARGAIRLLRGATTIYQPFFEDASGPIGFGATFAGSGATSASFWSNQSLDYKDSPATTSAVTYKTQGRPYVIADSGLVLFQPSGSARTAISSITLMEIEA